MFQSSNLNTKFFSLKIEFLVVGIYLIFGACDLEFGHLIFTSIISSHRVV